MVKPFDPEGLFFSISQIAESVDDKVPEAIRFEIERTVVDEIGWSSRVMVDSEQDIAEPHQGALVVYTVTLDMEGSQIGRFILSPRRFDITPDLANNVYIRYTAERVVQFFFHHGWNTENARSFINDFYAVMLNPGSRYRMTVRELAVELESTRLDNIWRELKNRGDHV